MKPFRRSSGDDRGSLPMAMLITGIGLALSAALLPIILRQIEYTRSFTDRSTSLNGAQIGLDVMLARVRAASEAADNDVLGRLEDMPPCTVAGDAGVDGTGEKLLYVVDIIYRDADDVVLSCDPLTELPYTATVKSTGTSTSGGSRTLTAKYTFWNENDNIPGGAIKISSPTDKWCMDAGKTGPPAAGAPLTMQLCNGSIGQLFGYTEELYLKLINSEAPANDGQGMCLNTDGAHTNNVAVVFLKCPKSTDLVPTRSYQWGLDSASRFPSTSAAAKVENFCIHVKTKDTAGSSVVLTPCASDAAMDIWRSDASVGAGMAGDKTNQLVNFAQFSRCLDVTGHKPSEVYMIAWFCKQAPDAKIDWNQMWVHPVPTAPAQVKTGTIEFTKPTTDGNGAAGTYCLKSPLSAGANPYVTTMLCGTRTDPAVQWSVYHDTGVYATSYRIEDSKGFCLQPSDLTAKVKEVHGDGTSKVKVAVCSKSELQKWNAPANLNKLTPISGVEEK